MDESLEETIAYVRRQEDPFQKARSIESLVRAKRISVKELGLAIGMKPSYLCHIMRLTKLPPMVVDGFFSSTVSLSHLFVISRLKTRSDMAEVYERVLTEGLTVALTDEAVREKLYKIKNDGEYLSRPERDRLERVFDGKNIRVKVMQSKIKGKVVFEVRGNLKTTSSTLRRLMNLLAS